MTIKVKRKDLQSLIDTHIALHLESQTQETINELEQHGYNKILGYFNLNGARGYMLQDKQNNQLYVTFNVCRW